MPDLTKEQQCSRVNHHSMEMMKKLLILQVPLMSSAASAIYFSTLSGESTGVEKAAALTMLSISTVSSVLGLADMVDYADKVGGEYASWGKSKPLTKALETEPPAEMKQLSRPQYQKLLLQAGGDGDTGRLLEGEDRQSKAKLDESSPGLTDNSLMSRARAMRQIAQTFLDPKSKRYNGMMEERVETLKRIGINLLSPITSSQGFSLTENEKAFLFKVLKLGSLLEQSPVVLIEYENLTEHILFRWLDFIKLQQSSSPAQTLRDSLLSVAIREGSTIPAGMENKVSNLKARAENRVVITDEDAYSFAKQLVAISYRWPIDAKDHARDIVRDLLDVLPADSPDSRIQKIHKIIRLQSFVFREEMNSLAWHHNRRERIDPLQIIKKNIAKDKESVIMEGKIAHIRVKSVIDADELVCAIALVYPEAEQMDVEVDGDEFVGHGILSAADVYEHRLLANEEIFVACGIKLEPKNNVPALISRGIQSW